MTRKLINVEGENKKANKRSKSASGIPDTTSENVAVQENEKDQGHDQNQGEGEGSLPLTQQQSSIASSQNISNTAVPLTIDNVTSHWTWEMIQKSADYLKYRVGCIGYDNDVANIAIRAVFKYMKTHFKQEHDSWGNPIPVVHSHIHAPRHAKQIVNPTIPKDAISTEPALAPRDDKKSVIKLGYGYNSLFKQNHDAKISYSLINFCAIHGDPLPVSLVEGESDCHCAAKAAFKKVHNPDHQDDALTVSIEAISHIMGVSKVLLKKWIGYYLTHGGELVPAEAVIRKCLHPSSNSAIESIHRSEVDVHYHDDHINEILNNLWIEPVEEEATGAVYYTILCKSSPGVAGDEFDIYYDVHHAKEHGFITKDRVAEFVWQTHPLDWKMLFKLDENRDKILFPGSTAGQQQKKKVANQKQKVAKSTQPQIQSVA